MRSLNGAPVLAALALAAGLLAGPAAQAVEPHSFSVSAGAFNIFDPDVRAEAGAEAQLSPFRLAWFPRWLPDLTPDAGAMVNDQGSFYVYGGLRCDIPLGRPWELSIQFAPGLYRAGGGFDLGGAVEFRSGIELSYPLAPRGRVGLLLFHLSNAGIYTHNPGSESLVLTYRYRL
ncbi:MAG TPA: acyloxyacyl hydrolase [Thermoanaerobaculia bacterium]|nr:acyloxyacyl hydrolase [Thermoanaerobaculia bacterium]